MRREPLPPAQRPRLRLAGVVAPAVVGSIALTLGAHPASAAAETMPRPQGLGVPAGSPDVAAMRSDAAAVRSDVSATTDYVVVLGDTLSRIAAQHGVRVADLLVWNELDRGAIIRPGDVIRLGPGSSAIPSSTPAPSGAAYTVTSGDTPWSIADAAGVSVADLLAANGLGRDAVIFPGQVLALPGGFPAASPAPAPAAAPAASVPLAAASYTVVAGDTLSAVAARHGLGLDAVLSANGLDRSSIIYPDQVLIIPGTAAAPAVATVPASTAAADDLGLDDEQIANARLIIQVGRERGVPDRGIAIALATAMVESWIRNLDWGDRDSLGLFQQRPSTGWGTPDQVRDAARASATFYGGSADPNGTDTRGLLDIAGWESMAFTDAAQAVQISAHPERYGEWEQQAYRWLAALG